MRARHHHEEGPYRGRRCADGADRALRPAHARGGFSRRGARPAPGRRPNEEPADRQFDLALSARRIGAMIARYLVSAALVLAAPARPDLLAGGADADVGLPAALSRQNSGFFARAGGIFIGAVLLWDILFRGQLGFSVSFLEEMWSRNLANLMISPLRPVEFVLALMVMSIVRLAIGMVPVSLLAIALLRLQPLWTRPRARRVLCQPDPDELGGRYLRVGPRHCATASAPRASPGPSCSCSCRSPASTIRLQCCRAGCSGSPWRCRRPTYSRVCARY